MRAIGWAAICGAAVFGGQARADTFILTNTQHPDCGFDASVCAQLTGNGFVQTVPGGTQLFGADDTNPNITLAQQEQYETFGPQNTTTYLATALSKETLVYSFDYLSLDTFGNQFDPGGYLINGAQTQVSFNQAQPMFGTNLDEPGSVTFDLNPGDTYGFYIHTGDSTEGAGTITFRLTSSSLPSAVPEPTVWSMLLMGFGSVGAALRRRRAVGRAVPHSSATSLAMVAR
jgi:hypothetical protein